MGSLNHCAVHLKHNIINQLDFNFAAFLKKITTIVSVLKMHISTFLYFYNLDVWLWMCVSLTGSIFCFLPVW